MEHSRPKKQRQKKKRCARGIQAVNVKVPDVVCPLCASNSPSDLSLLDHVLERHMDTNTELAETELRAPSVPRNVLLRKIRNLFNKYSHSKDMARDRMRFVRLKGRVRPDAQGQLPYMSYGDSNFSSSKS